MDLFKLAALIECMSVLVVVGTGPLHIASALRVASVSPFCRFTPFRPVYGECGWAWRGRGATAGFLSVGAQAEQQPLRLPGTLKAEDLYREVCRVLKMDGLQ